MVEAHKELTETTDNKQNFQDQESINVKTTLFGKVKQWRKGWGERWSRLHANQIIYVIALVLYFTVDGEKTEPNTLIWLIGLLAFFGMARELWAIFVKVWESMLGRLLLLVSYAAIANFTLALASQKVNMVIGADPSQLYHTQGLTTLLMLPLWLMIVSIVAVIFMFGLLQILKLVTGLFIFMRIIGKRAKPKEAFPKTFIIIRLVLLFPVTMTMTSAVGWYGDQLNLADNSGLSFNVTPKNIAGKQLAKAGIAGIEESLKDETITEKEREDLLQLKEDLQSGIDDNFTEFMPDEEEAVQNSEVEDSRVATVSESANDAPADTQEPTETSGTEVTEVPETQELHFLDQLIASFVYNFEAFQFSHCDKTPTERVVYISESEILAVIEDSTTATGYRFSTRTCVVK